MDIQSMTTLEKLQAMEQLWDSLEEASAEPPAWHGAVLEQRRQVMKESSDREVELSALKARGAR
ncbi:putative addiction module component [Tamilnaduibacter salinus]|uniref:Putative addiction module component n=1 Tax=Tamilnaduibacter salinus TaxID=1484056 RepID=A0A2U1CVH8_9GAMM|nr:addiction module protein [Tamilnaduibacter salinus]PVY75500.1 putative addiction module component [Tamilnaduibacter salinus]